VYLATNQGLYVLNSDLTPAAQFGERQDNSENSAQMPGVFRKVNGIGVMSNGDVVIADTNSYFSQVIRISPADIAASTETAAIPPPPSDAPPPAVDAPVPTADTSAASGDTGGGSGGSLADALQSGDAPSADDGSKGGALPQWATMLVATSEYTDRDWSMAQATGAPDTFECGDFVTSWASAEPASQEVLTFFYAQAVIPTQVNVHQTYNPGSIIQVVVVPADGTQPIVLPNSADPIGNTPCPGVFTVNITGVTVPVNAVVVYLDQGPEDHWTEIDAVELVGNAP
jgi:hypothetical protein